MDLQQIASASALLKQELAPLAEKIGQGAEYTFGLFVKQVYVNAIGNMLWVVPGIISFILAKKCWDYEKHSHSSDGAGYFGWLFLMVVGLFAVLLPLSDLIQVIINPEFKAIELIVSTFRTTTGR